MRFDMVVQVYPVFEFYKWFSINIGWKQLKNVCNNLNIVLMLPHSFWVVALISHATLHRTSSHEVVVGSPDII